MQTVVNQNRALLYRTCQVSLLVPSQTDCWIVTGRTRKGKNKQNFCLGNLTSSISVHQAFQSKVIWRKPRWWEQILHPQLRLLLPQQRKRSFLTLLVLSEKRGAPLILLLPETFQKLSHINKERLQPFQPPSDFTRDWLHLQLNHDFPRFRTGTEQVKKLPFRLPSSFIILSCMWLLRVAK